MDILDFCHNHSVDEDFDEAFYANIYPETEDFYQPYCNEANISNRQRLFFHWHQYGKKLGMLKNKYDLDERYKLIEKPRNYQNQSRLCLIVHCYYIDIWEQEIVEPIKNIPTEYDLYVTVPKNSDIHKSSILKHFPNASILEVENKGSDVWPFIYTLRYLRSNNLVYDYTIKLHTKKSTHINQDYAQKYRKNFYNNLCYNADYCLRLMECDDTIGMVAPPNTILSLTKEEDANNIVLLESLLNKANIKDNNIKFVAGTMFAYRCSILNDIICNLNVDVNDFQDGHQQDGTLAHAFERFFCSIVRHKDKLLYTLGELPSDFDHREYSLINPDLHRAFGTNKENLEHHYLFFGKIEQRKYKTTYPFNKLLDIANTAMTSNKAKQQKSCIILVNHACGLHGASLGLQNLANYLQEKNIFNHIIFVDTIPNDSHVLNDAIEIVYTLNDKKNLLNLLDSVDANLIIANSLNIISLNHIYFRDYLHKTIFFFHECIEDINDFLGNSCKQDLFEIISSSKKTFFVAQKILNELLSTNDAVNNNLKHKVGVSLEILYGKNLTKILNCNNSIKKNKRVKIGMCGSLCERKNPKLFIDLAIKNPQHDFIWIGGDLSQMINTKIPNLDSVTSTPNPQRYFSEIDYFLLTSTRDPCPYVVLENLVLNNKVILLEDNIKYEHDIHMLENVNIISDHNNSSDIITKKLTELNLNTQKNKTNKNRQYVLQNFTGVNNYHLKKQNKKNIILSYYSGNRASNLSYYTNIINQRILYDNDISNVYISLSSDNPDELLHDEQFFTNNILPVDDLFIIKTGNTGWDIGGLVSVLSSYHIPLDEYIIYIHNKSNPIWREELFRILYYSEETTDYDSIVCKDHFIKCSQKDKNREIFLQHDFMQHLYKEEFDFISGTCFTTKLLSLKPLIDNLDKISCNLTNINTDDSYWRQQMLDAEYFNAYVKSNYNNIYAPKIDEDSRQVMIDNGSKNYFELLFKHNKKGIADHMFEHAIERYIGYLISHNKQVIQI